MSGSFLQPPLGGFVWVILALGFLYLSQRLLQHELGMVLLLATHHPKVSSILFALVFFPGVFLHEISHFTVAKLLGVRTGRFSLIPQSLPDGQLRLGFVEIAKTSALKDALIGAAPMISGSLSIAWIGLSHLQMGFFVQQLAVKPITGLMQSLSTVVEQPDFWLWFYLVFAISSTMFPSPSDRRSWLPVGVMMGAILCVGLIAGIGPWLISVASPLLDQGLYAAGFAFNLSLVVQVLLLLPCWLLRVILMRITQTRLAYR